ncbi:MAG: hypothetical protein ACYCXY_12310 [Acidimicrobiales bacterium]
MALGVVVVASLVAIAAYVLMFVAVAASTALGAHRRDPLAEDLDEVLVEILGTRSSAGLVEPGRSHPSRRC